MSTNMVIQAIKHVARTILTCTLLVLLQPFLFSCSEDEALKTPQKVNLTLKLGSPAAEVTSRGVSDDFENKEETWTDWELLVDGSKLYRVTLLLTDRNYNLVAVKDFNEEIRTAQHKEVSASFQKLNPNTTYRVVAIANYSAVELDGKSWDGLQGLPELANLVPGTNIASTITALNNYELPATGSDCVAARMPQPLTYTDQFTTPANGDILIDGTLLRSYARLRIEIRNQSDKYDLMVNSLAFGDATSKFGHTTEHLLQQSESDIHTATGNLNPSSLSAITPFVSPLKIGSTHSTNEPNSKVVFDTYLYEFKNTSGMKYTLNLGYQNAGTTQSKEVYIKGTGSTSTTNNSTGLYMIGEGQWYLAAGQTSVAAIELPAGTTVSGGIQYDKTLVHPAIWKVTRNGSYVTIQSAYNDKYMRITTNSLELGNSQEMRWSSGRVYCYLGGATYNIHMNNGNPQSSRWYYSTLNFYPISEMTIEETTDLAPKNYEIPLHTIVDGYAEPTTLIRRNDFVNVLVTVAYNENAGTLDFQVEDWITDKGGDVTFE